MELDFKKFSVEDIKISSLLVQEAFNADSQMYLGFDDGPTGYDNGELLQKYFVGNPNAFVIFSGHQVIAAVSLKIDAETQVNEMEILVVRADLENQSYGTKIWQKIETMYPETRIWKVNTPAFSKRNIAFYVNKCGFKVVEIKNPKADHAFYCFEKEMENK